MRQYAYKIGGIALKIAQVDRSGIFHNAGAVNAKRPALGAGRR
jgi:hypothetical protein